MTTRGKKILNLLNIPPCKNEQAKIETNEESANYSLSESFDTNSNLIQIQDDNSDVQSLPEDVQNALQQIAFDSDDSVRDPNFEITADDSDISNSDEIINRKRSNENAIEEILQDTEDGQKLINNTAKRLKGDTRKVRKERKLKRNAGKEYTTRSNKLVPGKEMKQLKLCRNKCKEKFSDETRLILFNDFWTMGDYKKRVQYINGLLQLQPKKTARIRSDTDKRRERTETVVYYFSINGELKRTCKDCFVKTFNISNKFVDIILNKKKDNISGIFQEDYRGSHNNRKNIADEDKQLAKNHILSIPSYESHYTRKRTSKKYLPSYYTLANLYQSYKNKYPENYINRKLFETIFHSLNIKIKQPKKDTCGTCDKLQMKIKICKSEDEKEAAKNELNSHHAKADEGYSSKSADKTLTKTDVTKQTICFDLQQCLPTPDLQSGESFYKRLLWTYDLTVHDCDESQAYCYLWYESLAKRGGNEIGSCLYKYLFKDLDPAVHHVIMYSDSCAGQNKNSFISAACFVALQNLETLKTIDHKFLLPGHTHMECDTDHSLIERQKKRSHFKIEHPHDWAQLIRQVGKKKPFRCDEMVSSDFLDFASLYNTSLTNRKQNSGSKINWREVRWLRYQKNEKTIFYKNSLDENESFKAVNFEKRGKSQAVLAPKLAYEGPVPISKEKKQHLIELLPYVSESLRDFYRNLPSVADQVDVFPDASSDEED